jgi:aspartyl/glutamyl-tRNA(Asn/Gln) amidotransferase C subunit
MIKVDHVLVNHLEQLAKIELNTNEREKLRLEIIQALEFIDSLEAVQIDMATPFSPLMVELNQLRNDQVERTLFDFFKNVPEQVEDYVVVSTG